MPNYCFNTVIINANEDTFHKILTFVSGREEDEDICFDFNKVIPIPEEENSNWNNWCSENWGTKWNSVEVEVEGNSITFYTAWSPCIPVVEKLAMQFPEANFWHSFYEEGYAFCGVREYRNGRLVYNMNGSYSEKLLFADEETESSDSCAYEISVDNIVINKLHVESGHLSVIDAGHDYFITVDGIFEDSRPDSEKVYWL